MTSQTNGFPRLQFEVSDYDLDGCRVLSLSGECDAATHEALRAGLANALTETPGVLIVDLLQLVFCDGRGAALILGAAQTNPVVLAGLSGTPRQVFDLLDPVNEVPRYRTLKDAADDLSARA